MGSASGLGAFKGSMSVVRRRRPVELSKASKHAI